MALADSDFLRDHVARTEKKYAGYQGPKLKVDLHVGDLRLYILTSQTSTGEKGRALKIGITTLTPSARAKAHQTGHPYRLRVAAVGRSSQEGRIRWAEELVRKRLTAAGYWSGGGTEWFLCSVQDVLDVCPHQIKWEILDSDI